MLRELPRVRQVPAEPRRRWFADDYFDLIVWLGDWGEFVGFQLCYDLEGEERALTWKQGAGFSHQRVDSGDLQRPFKATPILVMDGDFDAAAVSQLFQEHSRQMDRQVAEFVLAKIADRHPERRKLGRTEGL
jgi:hypothetical protein